jgi:hypothetical protein
MNRNIKYKQVCRLVVNGGDDLNKMLIVPNIVRTIIISSIQKE